MIHEMTKIKKTVSAFFTFCVLSIACLIGLSLKLQVGLSSSNGDWPMFHHDLSHSGYSTSAAPNNNEILWNYTTITRSGTYGHTVRGVFSSPAVADGKVYVGSHDDNVYCLNASTGAKIWNYTTGDNVISSPAVVDGNVYVGSDDGKVYCFSMHAALTPPEVQVGVKAGDWIKIDYTIAGAPSGTPLPEWLKMEFLSVEGTSATIRVTMHMSDGTEQSDTLSVDVVAGGGTFDTLFGFVIPANCTTGDSITMGGDGFTFNVTIEGETTRTYAGASRTVVYTSFSQYGTDLTYYWDKQTGVMVEASAISGTITGTAKATETNIWQAAPSGLPIEPTVLYALIVVIIAIVVAVAFFTIRKKKKTPEEVESPQS